MGLLSWVMIVLHLFWVRVIRTGVLIMSFRIPIILTDVPVHSHEYLPRFVRLSCCAPKFRKNWNFLQTSLRILTFHVRSTFLLHSCCSGIGVLASDTRHWIWCWWWQMMTVPAKKSFTLGYILINYISTVYRAMTSRAPWQMICRVRLVSCCCSSAQSFMVVVQLR